MGVNILKKPTGVVFVILVGILGSRKRNKIKDIKLWM